MLKTFFDSIILQKNPIGFLIFFLIIWFGVGTITAYTSGWRALATRFLSNIKAVPFSNNDYHRMASGVMGPKDSMMVNYRNCLILTYNPQGIHLQLYFLFRFLCPPLLIPWEQVYNVEEETYWFFTYYTISIKDSPYRIMVHGVAGERLIEVFQQYTRTLD